MLWEVDIYPASGQADREASEVAADAADLGFSDLEIATSIIATHAEKM